MRSGRCRLSTSKRRALLRKPRREATGGTIVRCKVTRDLSIERLCKRPSPSHRENARQAKNNCLRRRRRRERNCEAKSSWSTTKYAFGRVPTDRSRRFSHSRTKGALQVESATFSLTNTRPATNCDLIIGCLKLGSVVGLLNLLRDVDRSECFDDVVRPEEMQNLQRVDHERHE